MNFTAQQIAETKAKCNGWKGFHNGGFLSCLLVMHNEDPEKLINADVLMTCLTNIGAGSQACIKESLRLHPATELPLGQVVPKGEAKIEEQYFPAGVSRTPL